MTQDPVPILVTGRVASTYQLPGAAVCPESIGVDAVTGDAYAGSLADGTLYRPAGAEEAEVWSAGGQDGRTSVAAVKVDARDRLWAGGGYDGTLLVYDLARRRLLAQLDAGPRPSCVNDIAFGPDRQAYVTDSLIPVLFRADSDGPQPRVGSTKPRGIIGHRLTGARATGSHTRRQPAHKQTKKQRTG